MSFQEQWNNDLFNLEEKEIRRFKDWHYIYIFVMFYLTTTYISRNMRTIDTRNNNIIGTILNRFARLFRVEYMDQVNVWRD